MNKQTAVLGALLLVLALGAMSVGHPASGGSPLELRLQKLEDTEAIRTLLIKYGRALDQRDFAAYGRLFAKDGSWQGGMGSATSPQNIQKMVEEGFSKMPRELYEGSNHVMTSMDIEVNGDTATAWSRWLWVVKGADGKPHTERGGYYEDTLVRESGQWKFKMRHAVTQTTGQ